MDQDSHLNFFLTPFHISNTSFRCLVPGSFLGYLDQPDLYFLAIYQSLAIRLTKSLKNSQTSAGIGHLFNGVRAHTATYFSGLKCANIQKSPSAFSLIQSLSSQAFTVQKLPWKYTITLVSKL